MKTVIEMAKECGFVTGPCGIGVPPSRISINDTTDAPWMLEALERFAELVRADEREALETLYTNAHYIFNNPPGETSQEVRDVIEWYAAAIRARSNA